MQCDDHGHHCFMCDAHAAGSEGRQCQSCSNWTDLRTATCDLCNVEKDISFKRDLFGVDPNDRQSLLTCHLL